MGKAFNKFASRGGNNQGQARGGGGGSFRGRGGGGSRGGHTGTVIRTEQEQTKEGDNLATSKVSSFPDDRTRSLGWLGLTC